MGHAIHELLGFNFRELSLLLMAQNPFLRNLAFPFIDIAQKNMEAFVEKTVQQSQLPKYNNEREYFLKVIKTIEDFYNEGKLPKNIEQQEKVELNKIKSMFEKEFDRKGMLIKKSPQSSFLKAITNLGIKYLGIYEPWTTAEEVSQILGIIPIGDRIYVINFSDFDLSVCNKKLIRWLHIVLNIDKCRNSDDSSVCLCPSKDFVEMLFSVHGFNFEKYVQAIREKEKKYLPKVSAKKKKI